MAGILHPIEGVTYCRPELADQYFRPPGPARNHTAVSKTPCLHQ